MGVKLGQKPKKRSGDPLDGLPPVQKQSDPFGFMQYDNSNSQPKQLPGNFNNGGVFDGLPKQGALGNPLGFMEYGNGGNGNLNGDDWSYQYQKPYYPTVDPSWTSQKKPMGFLDFLALAQGLTSGGGTDYSALIKQLKQNATEGDAHLKAMYDAYQGRLAASAPTIAQTYDTAGQGIDQNAAQATAGINDAYQSTRDAQTQQLAALGIGDAAGVLAANGGLAAADQAYNTSGVARAAQASGDLNTSNKGTALDYNTNFGNSVGMAGVEQRSALQQALQNKLAELEASQASDNKTNFSQSLDLAKFFATNPGLVDPNAAPDVAAELDLQAKALGISTQTLKNQLLQQQLAGQGGQYDVAQIIALAQQNGIDITDTQSFSQFVQGLKQSGQFG